MAKHDAYSYEEKVRISNAVFETMANEKLICSLNKACFENKVPTTTVMTWIKEDPVIAEKYTYAKEKLAEKQANLLMEITTQQPERGPDGKIDTGWVNIKRLQMDAHKFALSKLNDRFGDKHIVVGDPSQPVEVNVKIQKIERVVIKNDKNTKD